MLPILQWQKTCIMLMLPDVHWLFIDTAISDGKDKYQHEYVSFLRNLNPRTQE